MIQNIYPVFMSEKLKGSCQFYKTYLGFKETFVCDWYISLSRPDGKEIAFIDASHDTIPEPNRLKAKGLILNIEVVDATTVYHEIQRKNNSLIVMPLRDEAYGQRHFMIQDPNDILLDFIESIPPSEAYLSNYISGGTES